MELALQCNTNILQSETPEGHTNVRSFPLENNTAEVIVLTDPTSSLTVPEDCVENKSFEDIASEVLLMPSGSPCFEKELDSFEAEAELFEDSGSSCHPTSDSYSSNESEGRTTTKKRLHVETKREKQNCERQSAKFVNTELSVKKTCAKRGQENLITSARNKQKELRKKGEEYIAEKKQADGIKSNEK